MQAAGAPPTPDPTPVTPASLLYSATALSQKRNRHGVSKTDRQKVDEIQAKLREWKWDMEKLVYMFMTAEKDGQTSRGARTTRSRIRQIAALYRNGKLLDLLHQHGEADDLPLVDVRGLRHELGKLAKETAVGVQDLPTKQQLTIRSRSMAHMIPPPV